MVDFDSSDDDEIESQSGNDEKGSIISSVQNQASLNANQNIPSANSIQDAKYCTMWIGNDDGRFKKYFN